jgi:quinol monooxygenase YgiN
MSERIHVVASFAVSPESPAEFSALVNRLLVGPTQAEPGCIRYELCQDCAEPTSFVMLETWASESDLDAHLAQPGLAAALDELRPFVTAAPVVSRYRNSG